MKQTRLLTILWAMTLMLAIVTQSAWAQSSSDIGKVLAADGKMYKTVAAATNAGTTASGIIAYWGAAGSVESGNSSYRGMVISLDDAELNWGKHPNHTNYCSSDSHQCSTATSYCSTVSSALNAINGIAATNSAKDNNGANHWHNAPCNGYNVDQPSGASVWAIPSMGQWKLMAQGLTGKSSNLSETDNPDYTYDKLSAKITAAGGNTLRWLFYWSSTEVSASNAYIFDIGGINSNRNGSRVRSYAKNTDNEYTHVRMFFAFSSATAAVYTISYNANGGSSVPSAQTKDGGIDLTLSSTVPTRTGFAFTGWNTQADGNGTTYASGATFTGNANTTLYAQWTFQGSGIENDPYLIPSDDVWNYLADQVNGGTNYSGKYFQQTGDFTVSSKIIGYPTNDTHYVTFNGIYDGNGHTITASINKSDERYVAPFHCIADATIKNVIVTGSVTVSGSASIERRRHPAGLVGVTDGTCILQNCRVSANVSGCDYMGGLIGHTQAANITITGCVYSGTLTASDKNNTGGLIGWGGDNGGKTYTLTNNLFAGSYSGSGKFHPVGFLYNPTGNTRTVTNTYYMTGLRNVGDDDGNSLVKGLANKGKFAYSITSGTGVTVSNAGTPTTYYNVSDITSYGIGIKYGEVLYGGNSDVINLNLTATNHAGYSVYDHSTNNGSLTGDDNPYTLTMTNDNATISARYSAAISIAATTTNAKDGWYLIASPMGTVSPSSVTNLLSNNYDLFRFNQSAEMEWQNWEQTGGHYHFNLEPGRGYLYANSSDVTLTFIGTPYSGTGEVNLEYSTANPDERMRGWNLIGNPFGVQATIDKDCYKMNDETHTEVILRNKPATVDPMEGVFVQATAENQSVTFSTGAKRETAGSEDCIVINLSGSKGTIIDRAIVSFDNGRTLPKFQIKENSTKLYIPQKGTDYAIAFSYRIGELPLNFKPQETGVYTLGFSGENMNGVSLVDVIDNAEIDLSVNDTYTFIGSPNDREDRFKLVFSSPNDSNIDIFAYQTGTDIVVSGEGELQVFDVMGRMVMQQRIDGVQTIAKPLQTGVYILRLNEKSQKIVVR